MLKKSQRLKDKRAFDQLFQRSRPIYIGYLKIRSRKIKSSQAKIGLIVSTRISKQAVERNRLKRQLRAILRPLLDRGRISHQAVVITLVRKPAPEKSWEELKKNINEWLKISS